MILKVYKNNKWFEFIIDDEDYEKIKDWKFSAVENGSDSTYLRMTKDFYYYKIQTYFHRYITNCPTKLFVDHINNNSLDNRKENLRIVNTQQNRWNSRKTKNKKESQYIGVYFNKQKNRWTAKADNIYLGLFKNEKDAAYAYDTYCRKFRGEYSKLNFPNDIIEIDIVQRRK